jgi:hypothetical protein
MEIISRKKINGLETQWKFEETSKDGISFEQEVEASTKL